MRIPEKNRNMLLLAAVTLCCIVVAGTAALFDPPLLQDKQATDIRQVRVDDLGAVRVVGAPFVPNVNPRQR